MRAEIGDLLIQVSHRLLGASGWLPAQRFLRYNPSRGERKDACEQGKREQID